MSLLSSGLMMTGDIWSTGAFSFESPLKDLLDSDDFTLEQLLAEDELLQEVRGVHPKLIAYLTTPEAVTKLVEYVILPPPQSQSSSATASDTSLTSPTLSSSTTPEKVLMNGVSNAAAANKDDEELDVKNIDQQQQQKIDNPKDPGHWLQQLQENETDDYDNDDNNNHKKAHHRTDDPDIRHIRFPYMACEIICSEISGLIDVLMDSDIVRREEKDSGNAVQEEESQQVETNETKNVEQEEEERTPVDQIISEGDNPNVELVNLSNDDASSPPSELQPNEEVDETRQQQQPTKIVDLLFSLLETTPVGQLDDYRAGYFEKILRVLFKKRSESMVTYMNSGGSGGGGGGRKRQALIQSMLQHLYSHSIMLIAQRLLLPQRPVPAKHQPQVQHEGDDDDDDEAAQHPQQDGEEEEEEEDHMDGEIKSDWSNSSEALELLLDSLMGGGNANADSCSPDVDDEEQERRVLDLSLNASEVLITIIQNSLLSSQTMLSLTEPDALERLISVATTVVPNKKGEEYFSPHESLLTTAMSVLESLILQLGGYGAVGTMQLLSNNTGEGTNDTAENVDDYNIDNTAEEEATIENQNETGPIAVSSPDTTESASVQTADDDNNNADPKRLIADLSTLLDQLPVLLYNLSLLLQHPSTHEWRTYTQYSKDEAQPMVGSSRLRIVRVLESLVLLGDPQVDACLVQSDCLEICLNLFWDFQWCSMLHQSVANLLVHVFEGQNARVDMQEYFLIRCNILVRLMDSFVEAQYSPPRIAEVVMNINDVNVGEDGVLPDSEKGSNNSNHNGSTDPLPVSEDDVDAALEKEAAEGSNSEVDLVSTEAVQFESRDPSITGNVGPPPQSFRFGYMGHVIIICQALVHASRNDFEDEERGRQQQQQHQDDAAADSGESKASTSSSDGGYIDDANSQLSKEPLFLAEMVACHPLSDKWNEFVANTLATETSVQSTPLGGYSVSGGDPLHAHRPGLADDSDPLGDGADPPLPPHRGILTGGEAIDMDDNDLDIAASMMASLSLGRARSPDSDDEDEYSGGNDSGDSERSYNSGETNNSQGYLFDDPLGKVNGGLGISLGNLTKFLPGAKKKKNAAEEAAAAQSDDSSSDEESSHSSSDEEPERRESDSDVPVMDLFAGNFDYDNSGNSDDVPDSPAAAGTDDDDAPDWSNFANFDEAAFDAQAVIASGDDGDDEDDFGPFAEASDPSVSDKANLFDATPESPDEVEAIFGGGTEGHASLLEAEPFMEQADAAVVKEKPETVTREPEIALAAVDAGAMEVETDEEQQEHLENNDDPTSVIETDTKEPGVLLAASDAETSGEDEHEMPENDEQAPLPLQNDPTAEGEEVPSYHGDDPAYDDSGQVVESTASSNHLSAEVSEKLSSNVEEGASLEGQKADHCATEGAQAS